jgi:putative transposase
MARFARIVVPDVPHLVTQRGNRRQQTFFNDADRALYKRLVATFAARAGVAIWAYCLMPNHVHLIMLPATADGLARALGEAHRRYTRQVNMREGWTGYLWQGRFASAPVDDHHLLAAARYIEQNPARAGLVQRPADWPWSSARAHLEGRDDALVQVAPLLARVPDWAAFLAAGLDQGTMEALRRGERTGRPLGTPAFIADLEVRVGRRLAPRKAGRKPKAAAEA